MIDTTISVGNIFTAITVAGTLFFTTGTYSIKKTENDVTDLKVSVAKIETQLDDRFDRLEEIILDLE